MKTTEKSNNSGGNRKKILPEGECREGVKWICGKKSLEERQLESLPRVTMESYAKKRACKTD